jgi:hypothetical protein
MSFSKHGKFWYRKESWQDYEKVPWHMISESSRRKVMKHLMPKPAVCPFCGAAGRRDECYGFGSIRGDGMSERVLILVNRSGKLHRELNDWYWTCRDCYYKEQRQMHFKFMCEPGTKRKPWSELTRQSKMFRIRKVLPMPAVCPYCDSTTIELVSKSGTWSEDITDYTWCCRKHALVFAQLSTYHKVKVPRHTVKDQEYIALQLRELFPHWYNVTMAGTFTGNSIIDKNCAGGRFVNIQQSFF